MIRPLAMGVAAARPSAVGSRLTQTTKVEEVVTGTRTADDAYDSYLRVKEGQQQG